MRLAVITGYVIASLFALCGLFNTVQFCMYGSYATVGDFISGLLIVLHPLAVATIILLLAQILCRSGQHSSPAEIMQEQRPQQHPDSSRAKEKDSRHNTPQRYFTISEESPATTPAEPSPNEVPDTTQEPAPESEEKLQFFKLH